MTKIGVIGGGAWGTALAQAMTQAENHNDVLLWARESELVSQINQNHENRLYLKDVPLSPLLRATDSLNEAAESDILLMVTPAQHIRATLSNIKSDILQGKMVVICAKGIEVDSGLLLSQVAEEVVPSATIAIMSGPTFAGEIARGLPSAVTIATKDKDVAQELKDSLAVKTLRPYVTTDVIGAQLGGALKNVIAIACGIVEGRKMGDSARAALLTRGVAEMARLAVAMGAQKETLLGMCGIGDLMLTCSSMQSRNYSLGVALGQGQSMTDILKDRKAVTEGVHTSRSALTLAHKHAVDMPITEAVNHFLNEGGSIDEVIEEMLNRPFGYEIKGH